MCDTLLTLVRHSCRTLLWDTLLRHSCGTLSWTSGAPLWHGLVGHSCGTLYSSVLWDTLVGHFEANSCRTLLLETLVGHSLLWDTLVRQSCGVHADYCRYNNVTPSLVDTANKPAPQRPDRSHGLRDLTEGERLHRSQLNAVTLSPLVWLSPLLCCSCRTK